MNKVAIYCRLSDEDKDKTNKNNDSESIQNQKNLLTEYAYNEGWFIYKIYSDDDWSGLDSDRPEFNQMINDAKNKKFNIVLCKSQSRFTRDMELVEKYLHNKFIEWNIRFVGLTDFADTSIKGNKKSRQINGLVNEWYCEDVSNNVKAIFDNKRKNGKFIGSFAPYGYKKSIIDNNKLVVDKEAADIVSKIFNLYLEGNGVQHIAYILNTKGIPNPTKYKQINGLNYVNSSQKNEFGLWNKTTIKRILKNQVYIGNMVQGKRKKINYKSKKIINLDMSNWIIVKDTHEPIIDKQIFYLVQKRLKTRIRSSGTGQPHLFASKVRCADCGSSLTKTKAYKFEYLRCKLYANSSGDKLCTSHSIRLDKLEKIVTLKTKQYINYMLNVENAANELNRKNSIGNQKELIDKNIKKIEKEIAEKIDVIKNLYIDKVKKVISEDMFRELSEAIIKEEEILEKRKIALEEEKITLGFQSYDIDSWIKIIKEYKDLDKLTPYIVNTMIDYIEVGEKSRETLEQKIKIHWLY